MSDNTFKCAVCEGVFEKGWSEEEAIKEMQDNFTVAIEKKIVLKFVTFVIKK